MSRRSQPWTPRLGALKLGHAQVWGSVRIVPVLREQPVPGLRLHRDVIDAYVGVRTENTKRAYYSYVPHGYVLRWGEDAEGLCEEGAVMGAALTSAKLDRGHFAPLHVHNGRVQRMVKRTQRGLAFLPLHLAMEGYLTFHFGGPSRLFSEYSQEVVRRGLSPRVEWSMRGRDVPDLDDALRVFEIHPTQVGVLLFVGDELTSAFVVPHHDDYRALHRDLLSDFYADTLIYHSLGYPEVPDWQIEVGEQKVDSLQDIGDFLARTRREWGEFHESLTDGFFGRPQHAKERRRLGDFSLRQLLPTFDPKDENHLGECITGGDGEIAYLKTYRLSAAQARRGYLLQQLAKSDWDLEECAKEQRATKAEFILRLSKAGFDYLLKPHVLEEARRQRR